MSKKWLKRITGVVVLAVAVHLGVPVPLAIDLGNKAAEQVAE